MAYTHYVFDFDGTLVNSLPDLTAAINHVAASAQINHQYSREQVGTMVGDGVTMLLQRAFPDEAHRMKQLRSIFDEYYARNCSQGTQIYEGVVETLSTLHAQGKTLILMTNKPQRFTLPMLQDLGLREFFPVVYCGDTLDCKKPDPAVMHHLLASLQLNPSAVLMVGDSANDILCAAGATVDSALVTYGYGNLSHLEELSPTYTLTRIRELLFL